MFTQHEFNRFTGSTPFLFNSEKIEREVVEESKGTSQVWLGGFSSKRQLCTI